MSVENVINKSFDTLEDKINNLSKQLTGEDIFDITTTGLSYYDGMIRPTLKNAHEYFKNNKGLIFEIEWMNPEEYLIKAFKIHKSFLDDLQFEFYIDANVNFELVEEYKQRTLSGSKMPIPVLDYNSMSQEGRHRAVVAQQLDVDEIPVLVVKPYEE